MEKDIKIEIIELYDLLDSASWEISETRRTLKDLETSLKDIENLKRELKRDGLYSDKLEEFLENYMKYYNK